MNRPRVTRWLRLIVLTLVGGAIGFALATVLAQEAEPAARDDAAFVAVCLGAWSGAVCEYSLRASNKLPVRFSLRTLLIVTAVVCVLLGVVVWMLR
jgi:hypothetical protein